ncbi:MAG TPA: hypothetical protein EYP21_01575 [Syntrophaceae bacterium]|nr:hypothetical protein [Syntrophaceae bacterium]
MDEQGGNTVKIKDEKGKEVPRRKRSSPLANLVISFLEDQGFEVYRMQSVQEAYQVKSDGEILRLYITRKG